MSKVAVVLSGCGVYDGTEIQEAVLTLLALDRSGHEIICVAPDIPQTSVINHYTGEGATENRNVLVESARIARGQIQDIAAVNPEEIDALVFPGGFGAAKNLSSFAMHAADCSVDPGVRQLILEIYRQKKPICAICISPALVAKVLGDAGIPVVVTIGTDTGTADAIRRTGAMHKNCPVDQCVIDAQNRVISTPAYMLASRISEVHQGIEAAVHVLNTYLNEDHENP
jgi:enhancing lycopene biosynthesis protein 2